MGFLMSFHGEAHHVAAPHVIRQKSVPQFSEALLVSLHLCKGRFLDQEQGNMKVEQHTSCKVLLSNESTETASSRVDYMHCSFEPPSGTG